MLRYNHIYNSTMFSENHNLAAIASDSFNVAIYVNDKLQEIVSPNIGTEGHAFDIFKNRLTDTEIVNLIYSGSKQLYSLDVERLIFGQANTIYIKNTTGKYLYTNSSGITSWSNTDKSKFFFNPYYFDSEYLWKKVFKQKPDNVTTSGLWDLDSEISLFNRLTITVDLNTIPTLVGPKVFNYFEQTGLTESLFIDKIISIKAVNGDKIKLKTDKEVLEFIYLPVTDTAQMIVPNIDGTTISRPLIHIPIRTINPNSESLYTKILNVGLNSFTVSITVQGITFNQPLNITRL